MNARVRNELAKQGAALDGEYYCLHHPDALVKKYRRDCDCRKPKPGLLLRAARENGVDLARSFFVGDALVDVKAGRAAGCRTILLGHITAFLSDDDPEGGRETGLRAAVAEAGPRPPAKLGSGGGHTAGEFRSQRRVRGSRVRGQ